MSVSPPCLSKQQEGNGPMGVARKMAMNHVYICGIGIGPTLAYGAAVFRKVICNSTQPLLCERPKVRHHLLRQN